MKWYSVKKYRPAVAMEGLLLRHVVAGCIMINYGTYNGIYFEVYYSDYKGEVTHFAIPDPIEIEE